MPSPAHSSTKQPPKHRWTGTLLILLTIITYTILFVSLRNNNASGLKFDYFEYVISVAFFLTMTLILSFANRENRKQAQDLAQEQQQYFDLIQQAADPVIVLNELGIIVSANSAVEHVSGYRPEELVNKHFLKLNILTGQSVARAMKEFLETLKGATRKPFELSMMRKGGLSLITEAHARRVRNPNGRIAVHVILRDITSRKNAEQALRQEKNTVQNYLNIAGVIMMTLDRNGQVTMINKKGCSILGFSENEIIGHNWFEKFLPPEETQDMKFVFNLLISSEENLPQSNEYHVVNKAGAKRLIAWSHTLIRDIDNNITGVLSSGQDISDKRLIEDQLSLQSTALETAANAIVITDKDGTIVWCNQSFTTMSGYPSDEVVGQNPRILKSGLHNEQFYANMWNTINHGKIWHGEIVNRRKDERLYTEEMTITPVRNREEKIEHFISIKLDITERKRLQQDLEQANIKLEANGRKLERTLLEMAAKNKQLQEAQDQLIQSEKLAALGVLSSGIAHEIKNPLAIISLSIEEFEAHAQNLDALGKNHVQMIKRAADRANNVIIELLRFARVSDLTVENINFNELIEGTLLLVRNNAQFKNIPIKHMTSDNTIEVAGDRILLEQVFFNLLINAIDSTEQGGSITINTRMSQAPDNPSGKDEIVIAVTDTGCGISPEILPKVFEPFFTTKEQGKGTGLGLSTVYTLLKRHQGTIDVRSTLGQGTTFTITLPLAAKP